MIYGKYYLSNKNRTGIYSITNLVNGKCYVGSTTKSFRKRAEVHKATLLKGNHKNKKLQRAYNKYGPMNFEFDIIEVIDTQDLILPIEQYWINMLNSKYNINKAATGGSAFTKEVIVKRSESTRQTWKMGLANYTYHTPWNKGKSMTDEQRAVLRVPKTNTPKRIRAYREVGIQKSKSVEVYDLAGNLLGRFGSLRELEEWSLMSPCTFTVGGRFNKPRRGKPLNFLSRISVDKAIRSGLPYKGLIFKKCPKVEGIELFTK